MDKGVLYLLPTPIGEVLRNESVAPTLSVLNQLHVFVVEELRTARRFLKMVGYETPFEKVTFILLNEQTPAEEVGIFMDYIREGFSVGLMSEAGIPCVADPGSEVVRIAHLNKITVVPLPGPSSILLALMASGASGQQFCFHGYLPIEGKSRVRKIQDMESKAFRSRETQIFMETPYRNISLMESLIKTCPDTLMLTIACNLMTQSQTIDSQTIAKWKKCHLQKYHKKPAVFVLFYP